MTTLTSSEEHCSQPVSAQKIDLAMTARYENPKPHCGKRERLPPPAESSCGGVNSGGRGRRKLRIPRGKYSKVYRLKFWCWRQVLTETDWQIRNIDNCTYLRNIPIILLMRTRSSGPWRQNSYFYLFRDATCSENTNIIAFLCIIFMIGQWKHVWSGLKMGTQFYICLFLICGKHFILF